VRGVARLCELPWFAGLYAKVYEILSLENGLPHPCEVTVLPPEEPLPGTRPSTQATAVQEERLLWFRTQPPPPLFFAHEVVHLVPGKPRELEEFYGYNLASLVLTLAERGIAPPANPVRLFEVRDKGLVLKVLSEVYGYRFKDLLELYEVLGVFPPFLEVEVENGAPPRPMAPAGVPEDVLVLNTLALLAELATHDPLALEVILRLLAFVRGGRGVGPG
jgi:hypothetical protein